MHRYLLEASDDPFVRPVDAHHDISFACIAYLRSGFDILDPHVPEEERIARVGKGFHALQLYAYEHWVSHLLTYANLNGGLEGEDSQPLIEQLTNLYEVHEQMKAQLSRVPDKRVEPHMAGDATQGFHYLINVKAREMVQATLRLRRLLKNEQRSAGKGMFLDRYVVGMYIKPPLLIQPT